MDFVGGISFRLSVHLYFFLIKIFYANNETYVFQKWNYTSWSNRAKAFGNEYRVLKVLKNDFLFYYFFLG